MATAALLAGEQRAAEQGPVEPEAVWEGERDERGRFTSQYNARWRALATAGEVDGRWAPDEDKRQRRNLGALQTLKRRPDLLAARLLCMGATPLLTEQRGFSGLVGPAGAWLSLLGGHPYMPATLDKCLEELGLLGVEEAAWGDHARRWVEVSKRWSAPGPSWMQMAIYVDATQDPYWTRRFAKSGKVSRVGRVMPCLTRVAISSGAGVGLVTQTLAGTASLKTHLLPLLERLDEYLGAGGEVGRLTVVDSEAGTAGMMWALHDQADRIYITVVKGQVLKGAEVEAQGPWQRYRKRDELREVVVGLEGKGAPPGGVGMRGVEMRRADSRRPVTTLFVTNGEPETLSTEQVASAYLARWPLQEQLFRDGRNGGGGNRSHGYGGRYVTHVALDTKLERAERAVDRAEAVQSKAQSTRTELVEAATGRQDPVVRQAIDLANKEARRTVQSTERARDRLERLRTTPREIYARDTGRDGLMTCLKMNALMLLEFVLKEYFGGLKMEWRTFIEQVLPLPVTVYTTSRRCRYAIHANPRQPERMEQLREACAEINRRKLRRRKRLLVFEVVETTASAGS